MLERMRAVQATWIGKAVIGAIFVLIIVGLSFFGFADLFRNSTANWVASVGGTEISPGEFRQAYQNQIQQLQQRLRRPVTPAQAKQLGLDRQVLSTLVTGAVLDSQARKLGLAISDPQIAKVITDDTTFAGANGQFDHGRFMSLLRDNGLTEQAFVRQQRQTYLRQELVDSIAGEVTAPKAALDALHRFRAETRSVDVVSLRPEFVGESPVPDDAVLQAFYDERKQQFAAPEYRKLVVLAVTPAEVAKPDAVTQEDVRKAYDAAPESRFGTAEKRTLQQIVFPTQSEAEAAALRLGTGTNFGDIAAERNVTGKDLDLGTVTRAQIFDASLADAAFALPVNGTSAPVSTAFGTVLVHVSSIIPGDRKSFDEVAPILKGEIATSPARTRDALRDIRDKVEDQRSSGKTLAESAKAAGLDVRTIDAVDATGHDKIGAVVELPDSEQVLRAAFASDTGVDNDVVQTRTGDQIWFEVQNVEAARQRPLAEAKQEVLAAWRRDDAAKRLAAKAEEMVQALGAGSSIEQVAADAANASIRHIGDLRRTGADGLSSGATIKIFDTPLGAAGSAEGENGARSVFKVLDSVVPALDPDAAETKQLADQYRAALGDDILTAYLTRLQESTGVKVNPTALGNAIGGAS